MLATINFHVYVFMRFPQQNHKITKSRRTIEQKKVNNYKPIKRVTSD